MTGDEILAWLEANEAQVVLDNSKGKNRPRWCVWLEVRGWTSGHSIREAVEARIKLGEMKAVKTSVAVDGEY